MSQVFVNGDKSSVNSLMQYLVESGKMVKSIALPDRSTNAQAFSYIEEKL